MELIAAALRGNRDVTDLRKLGVVVELRHLKFTDQFGRWIHVAECAVLANVHRGGAVDGILHLRRQPTTYGHVAIGVCCAPGTVASIANGLVVAPR